MGGKALAPGIKIGVKVTGSFARELRLHVERSVLVSWTYNEGRFISGAHAISVFMLSVQACEL